MRQLMAKLTRIESMVRELREELVELDRATPASEQMDAIGNVRDVTPVGWTQSFASLTRTEPTALTPFERIGSDIMVGFDEADAGSILCSQEPVVAAEGAAGVRVSTDVWIIRPVKWVTFEFSIPAPLRAEHDTFYFLWVGSAREPQRINVLAYRRVAGGEQFHDQFEPAYMHHDPTVEIRTIRLKREAELIDCKICLSFDPSRLSGFSIQDARLYVPHVES